MIYSDGDTADELIPAAEVADPGEASLHVPPAWNRAAAVWPVDRGEPLRFLGQLEAPDGEGVFVFEAPGPAFRVVQVDPGEQTGEQHYSDEDAGRYG